MFKIQGANTIMDYTIGELYSRARDAELTELFEDESRSDYGEIIEAV